MGKCLACGADWEAGTDHYCQVLNKYFGPATWLDNHFELTEKQETEIRQQKIIDLLHEIKKMLEAKESL
jgi:hypothetical protein